MKIGGLQLSYLPWLGYFDQISQCDYFIIYDDLQYTTSDWRNRNRIKTPTGTMWLTVPVISKSSHGKLINEVEIAHDQRWAGKHWRSLKYNYSNAPFFQKYNDFFKHVYKLKWQYVAQLNREIIEYCLQELNINTEVHYSSDLKVEKEYIEYCKGFPDSTERIFFICKYFGVKHFLEGQGGKNYIRKDYLKDKGILLEYHQYPHPVYQQRFGEFIPYLSIVDLLFNEGENSLPILTNTVAYRLKN